MKEKEMYALILEVADGVVDPTELFLDGDWKGYLTGAGLDVETESDGTTMIRDANQHRITFIKNGEVTAFN